MRIWRGLDDFIALGTGAISRRIKEVLREIIRATDYAGADGAAKIAAAFAACPADGAIVDAAGLSGAQTWASDPFSGVTNKLVLSLGAGTTTISVDVSIPSNITLKFQQGSILSINSGKVLTISGTIDAPRAALFTGSGTVIIKSQKNPEIYPQWWGATGDGSTDDKTALLAALHSGITQDNAIDTIQVGRTICLPPGTYRTSGPLYLRKGDTLKGIGATASIIKATSGMAAGPLLYIGFKSDGTQDSGGLVPVVRGIYFETDVGNANEIVGVQNYHVASPGTSRIAGFEISDNWFTTTIGAVLQGTDGCFRNNVADQCSHLLKIIGDGTRYGVTHSILVDGNRAYACSFAGIWIDGANDISITNNHIDYAKQYGIYFANDISAGTSYRIKVSGNHFTTSNIGSFYTSTQTDINIEWPIEDSEFSNNHFSRTRKAAIYLNDAGAVNLSFKGNHYQDTNDSAVIIASCGDGIQFKNESFAGIGNYAIDVTGGATQIADCYATGIFTITGLPANDYDKGAFRFQNASSAGSSISNCYTPSTTYAVAVLRSGATGVATRDNRSGWATADIYWFVTASEVGTTAGERVSNSGGGIITGPMYALNVGSGSTLFRVAQYSASLTPAATAANTAADQSFTFTGVLSTDRVAHVSPPAAFSGGLFIGTVRIAGSNSIAITFVNITAGSLTAPSGTYTVFVYQ